MIELDKCRIVRKNEGWGIATNYFYDPIGRLVCISNVLDEVTFIDYDNEISIETHIAENGNIVCRTYDFDHRLIYHMDKYGNETWFDKEGNVTKRKEVVHMNDGLTQKDREALIKFISEGYSFDEIGKALEEMKISNELLMEAEKYGWSFICKNRKLPINFIRKYADKISWEDISYYHTFTEDELREFADRIDWLVVLLKYDNLSNDFIVEFYDRMRKAVRKEMRFK